MEEPPLYVIVGTLDGTHNKLTSRNVAHFSCNKLLQAISQTLSVL